MSNLGERLKLLREEKGYTQEELSKKLNITRQSISNYEKNKRTPDYETIELIADFFNVDLDYLYGRTDVPNKHNLYVAWDEKYNKDGILEKEVKKIEKEKGKRIPVVGDVAAGIPIEAIEDIIDWEEITLEMAKSGKFFGLRIKGDSMSPRIIEGDVVIVRHQEDADSGDIVIAKVNGNEATCKKLIKNEDGITLQPFNPNFDPMYFSNQDIIEKPVCIIGKVVENRQKY